MTHQRCGRRRVGPPLEMPLLNSATTSSFGNFITLAPTMTSEILRFYNSETLSLWNGPVYAVVAVGEIRVLLEAHSPPVVRFSFLAKS